MRKRHEIFTRFFERPTRDKLREIIEFNTGEYDDLDFKKQWPEASKLAKHVLAFSNSGGGIIIVGVEEDDNGDLVSCGIEIIKDKAIISSEIALYLPENIQYEVINFSYTDAEYNQLVGKKISSYDY